MKKILLYLTVISATISMAAADIDLKLAGNFGVGLKGGTFRHKTTTSINQIKNESHEDKKVFVKKVAFTGSFEAKLLKGFSIKEDLKIKIGAGTSLNITKLPVFNEFVDTKNQEVPQNVTAGQTTNLRESNRQPFDISVTAFGTIEIEKILKDFSVYFGIDAGIDVILGETEGKGIYINKGSNQTLVYLLEKRKKRIHPKVKGYTGINYKGFEAEIGLGYPQIITIGLGYRFNF